MSHPAWWPLFAPWLACACQASDPGVTSAPSRTSDEPSRSQVLEVVADPSPAPAACAAPKSAGHVPGIPAVVALRASFRKCYERGLAADPGLAGSLVIEAKLGPEGDVASVSVSNAGPLSAIVECLEAAVRSTHFAKPEDGDVIRIPVTFAPK